MLLYRFFAIVCVAACCYYHCETWHQGLYCAIVAPATRTNSCSAICCDISMASPLSYCTISTLLLHRFHVVDVAATPLRPHHCWAAAVIVSAACWCYCCIYEYRELCCRRCIIVARLLGYRRFTFDAVLLHCYCHPFYRRVLAPRMCCHGCDCGLWIQ